MLIMEGGAHQKKSGEAEAPKVIEGNGVKMREDVPADAFFPLFSLDGSGGNVIKSYLTNVFLFLSLPQLLVNSLRQKLVISFLTHLYSSPDIFLPFHLDILDLGPSASDVFDRRVFLEKGSSW